MVHGRSTSGRPFCVRCPERGKIENHRAHGGRLMSRLKWLGGGAIYVVATVAFFFVVTGLLRGTAFLSAWALPLLVKLVGVTAIVAPRFWFYWHSFGRFAR